MNHIVVRGLGSALLAVLLTACASVENKGPSAQYQAVSGNELYDPAMNAARIKSEQLKNSKSGTVFDSAKNLSEHEQREKLAEHLSNGDAALTVGKTDMALFHYISALLIDQNNPALYVKIGRIHESNDNTKLATLAYQRALEADANHITALERLGRIELNLRRYANARRHFQRALEQDAKRLAEQAAEGAAAPPYDAESPYMAYIGLGVLADLNKDHEAAIARFKTAFGIRPGSASAANNIGYSYYLTQDLQQAESYFTQALDLDPGFTKAMRNLALVYVRRDRLKDSFNLLMNHTGDEPESYNTLGYLCMVVGKYEEADHYFNKAIELSPTYFEVAIQNREQNRRRYSSTIYDTLN